MQKNITVNLIPRYSVPTILRLSQFDFGYTVTADIFNGLTLYEIPTGQSVTVEGRKPDNNGYQYNAEYSGHTVTFTVEEQMTIVAGDSIVEIVFYSDGVRVGTANFILAIEPAPLNDNVKPSETSLPTIQEAVRAADNAAASAEQAETAANEAAATLANFSTVVADQVEQMQIHEGQTVIDGTLTVSGAAADAKASGDRIRALKAAVDTKAPVIISTASGSIATFADGVNDMPMQSVAVNIEPLQSGSGDPSPDNVRPISGWTAVDVVRAGKNLIQEVFTQDGSSRVSVGSTKKYSDNEYDFYLKSGKYTISFKRTDGKAYGVFYRNDITRQTVTIGASTSTAESYTFTVPTDGRCLLWIYKSEGVAPSDISNVQLELGSTATAYEPYVGETYPVTLPAEAGTVYGGTLDVVNGTLTVDRKIVTVNGTETINASSGNRFYITYSDARTINVSNQTTDTSVMCDRLKSTTWGALGQSGGNLACAPLYGNGINFRNDEITTVQGWKDYFSANPTQFSYALATPQSYTLTPTEIRTLLGNNTLWADAGTVDAQYLADTKLYIDGKIAELQALVLENNG